MASEFACRDKYSYSKTYVWILFQKNICLYGQTVCTFRGIESFSKPKNFGSAVKQMTNYLTTMGAVFDDWIAVLDMYF